MNVEEIWKAFQDKKKLLHAVKHKEVIIVKRMIEIGVKIPDEALFVAFDNGSLECAKILIENGCDLNATHRQLGIPPIFSAVRSMKYHPQSLSKEYMIIMELCI